MSLPEGWRETTLGELVIVIDSLHKTPIYSPNGLYQMVRVTDIKRGSLNLAYCFKVDKKVFDEFSKKHKPEKFDIVFSRVGSEGIASLVKENQEFCLGQNTVFIIPKERTSFLYYWLDSIQAKEEINARTTGSTQRTISLKSIKELNITLPPLQEQKAIANILFSFDEKIELLKEQNETLEQMAQGVFKEWFVDEVDKSWEVKTLGNIGKVVTGKTPSTKKDEYWGDDLSFITPTDFKNYGKFTFSSIRFLSKDGKEKMKKSILPKDSILVTCIGSDMGKVVISTSECLTNQQINSLILDDNYMIEYTYQYLKSIYSYLRNIALGGSTMPIINKSSFEEIEITIPSKELLIKYNSIVNILNEKLKNNTMQIQTLQKTRNTLLPKLMSGEVRVS